MLNLTTYYGFENVNNFLINNNKKEQSREGVGRVGVPLHFFLQVTCFHSYMYMNHDFDVKRH
jgi:hypothetical protein